MEQYYSDARFEGLYLEGTTYDEMEQHLDEI